MDPRDEQLLHCPAGRRIRYDADNRRLQRRALTYTTEPFTSPRVAGRSRSPSTRPPTPPRPCGLPTSTTSPLTDKPPLTQGALLGSHRALDPDRTWHLPDGDLLRPHHFSTRSAAKPVVPASSPLRPRDLPDRRIYRTPASAAAHPHHLRLPAPGARQAGARPGGGRYQVHQGDTPRHTCSSRWLTRAV
ncbi:peptidase S15 domain protein [Mycobacterium xenopi 4042]|uniref:Peptidase S15 domain protein n=1 Tax=Mycobacterium xenopi 4042 TaxID=1299334 RepID=X7ZJB3_MYCXE|nr:peptidase S15 domain protein [Mycobacterium xenopi 4042]